MALNLHKRINMCRLNAKYGDRMNMTDIARMADTSYPTAREWVDAWEADRFGLSLSDAQFIAETFGLVKKVDDETD